MWFLPPEERTDLLTALENRDSLSQQNKDMQTYDLA